MDDLLNEFLTETAESIEVVDLQLVQLEQDPNNKEVLDNIFRLVHTIKGTCGFLGLPRLESVAHASENVLGQFRDGNIEVTPHSVTVILESLDRIKDIMQGLEDTEEEPQGDDSQLVAKLDAIVTGADAPAEAAPEPEPEPEPEPAAKVEDLRPGEVSLDELEAAFLAAPGPDDVDEDDDSLLGQLGGEDTLSVMTHLCANRVSTNKTLVNFFTDDSKNKVTGLITAIGNGEEDSFEGIANSLIANPGFDNEQFAEFSGQVRAVMDELEVNIDAKEQFISVLEKCAPGMIAASAKLQVAAGAAAAGADGDKTKKSARTQSIRVNVDLLEDLMNMVSELVLTRNQLMQMVRTLDDSQFDVPLQRLNQCTTELQESVMKTRMQPIGNAWAKLPRIVRDLSVELGKKIELEMIGADTELDRQVLELIKDPLTHMVRNSADHGIEMPAERIAKGKPEKGTITLHAFHEGGHIVIEIKDDGKGLAVDMLKQKALEKGLATAEELENMSDAQIQKFIMHAGFSTAKEVTNVSGRGVGMDVVRTNIEKIGGTIDMSSTEGKGTTFDIKIPLTLAIVSAMIVEASNEKFAIPQISVLELVRASENSEYRIEKIKETPVLRLRDKLLPLVYISDVLGFTTEEEREGSNQVGEQYIVVAQVGAFTFGIAVDQVFDTEEIVVKPVAPILKNLSMYSGNTILGDGNVIMILDPNGMANLANSGVSSAEEEIVEEVASKAVGEDKETMLVFRAGNDVPRAVPLSLVARLEDIEVERVETTDGKCVVQYRGALMPLLLMNENCSLKSEGRQQVIVFTDGDKTMGLAVDEILDIVEEKLDIELDSRSPGIIGTGVVDGNATELIDVAYYCPLSDDLAQFAL